MTVLRLGYFNTGSSPDYGALAANTQRAYVPDALTQTVIFYELAGKIGRSGASTPSTRFAIGRTTNGDDTGDPGDVIAQTAQLSPSTAMPDSVSGAVMTGSITPFIGYAGDAFSLAVSSAGAGLGHGMIQKSSLAAGHGNYSFYNRSNGSSSLTDPIGGTPVTSGWMAVWANAEINVAPNTPTNVAPTGTLSSTDLTPQIEADFSDPNETLPNGAAFDYLNKVYIQVRRKSDGVMFWDSGGLTASSSERSAKRSSKAYAGTTLVAGTTYQQRTQHTDRAGAKSAWSAWTDFTIAGGGSVTGATGVAGKQNSQTPGPFVAQWNHPSLSANRAIIRIEDNAGNVLQTMSTGSPATITSTPSGSTFSVPWADTGFSALPRTTDPNEPYRWRAKARDTGGTWSPDWSGSRTFTVNATPNVPTLVGLSDGKVVTAPPLLSVSATDVDDSAGSLTVTIEIKRVDTTTVTRTATWNPANSRYEYQTVTATDLQSTFQTIQWRARASDGTSTSAYSGYRSFVYSNGPVVSLTAPTAGAVNAASSITVSWNVSSGGPQVKYRVVLTEVDPVSLQPVSGVAPYDTGDVSSASTSHVVSSGFLRNGKTYRANVTVTNSAPLSGTTDDVFFSVAYAAINSLADFSAIAYALHSATDTDAIRLEWSYTDYPADNFLGYDIYRTAVGVAPLANGTSPSDVDELGERKWIKRVPNPAQRVWVDGNVASGVLYLYELCQTIRNSLDEVSSAFLTAQASVAVPNVVLSSAINPETYGVELRYRTNKGNVLDSDLLLDKSRVLPIGAKRGRSLSSTLFAWSDTFTFELIDDRYMSADQRIRRFLEAVEDGGTLCLRLFSGMKRYVSVDSLNVKTFGTARYQVTMKVSEEDFTEGES